MKILVTGGAGFIGSNFVRRTLEDAYPGLEGAEVVVYDALTYSGNEANLAPVATVATGPAPVALAVAGARVLVACAGDATLRAHDAASGVALGTPLALPAAPRAVAVNPDGAPRSCCTRAAGDWREGAELGIVAANRWPRSTIIARLFDNRH